MINFKTITKVIHTLWAEESSNGSNFSILGAGIELRQEVSMLLGKLKFPIHLGCRINKDDKLVTY